MPVKNPFAFARTVLQRAMWGHYSGTGTKADERMFVQPVDEADPFAPSRLQHFYAQRGLAVAAFAGLDGRAQNGTQADLLELDEYFAALEQKCGRTAKLIASNLVSPSGRCSQRILEEAERKQKAQRRMRARSQRERRHQPRGVQNEIRLSQRVIRCALGLSSAEWARQMHQIRTFTRTWLSR